MGLSKRVLLTPSFGLLCGFVLASGYALFSLDYIELDLSMPTMLYILAGIVTFIVVASFIDTYIKSRVGWSRQVVLSRRSTAPQASNKIVYDKFVLIAFLVVQVFIIYSYRNFYFRVTGLRIFSEAIYAYRNSVMFGNGQEVRSIASYILYLRRFCVASGYVFSYKLIHGIIYKYKERRILLIGNIVLCALNNVMAGSRGPLIFYIIAIIVQAYFVLGSSRNWKNFINTKIVFRTMVVIVIVVGSFEMLGGLLGRGIAKTLGDYLAVYVSAPLKNLDTYVKEGQFNYALADNQTLYYLRRFIANTLHITSWQGAVPHVLRYNSHGYGLGNVYTMFKDFIHDGGVLGVVFYSALMALISELLFRKAIREKNSKEKINISIIIYSYLFPSIAMSFFSNKFYETLFDTLFVFYFIVWLLHIMYLQRIKIAINKPKG